MKEHGISHLGLPEKEVIGNIEAMFSEDNDEKYSPRALFCDLDPCTIDKLIQSDLENVISKNNIIFGQESSSSNFSRGHYTIGKEVIDEIEEKFQYLANECDSLKTIAIFSSISGGTGGGLSTLLIDILSANFRKLNRI